MGKTQLAMEWAHRNYQKEYGLVVWITAESTETATTDFCRWAGEMAMLDVASKSRDEVVEEMQGRLYRSRVRWLIVFDNVEDPEVISRFVPRGGGSAGGRTAARGAV